MPTLELESSYSDINYFKSGATSDIFVAFDEKLQCKMALKVLKLYLKDQPEIIKRFQKEAKILARFSKDSIVNSREFFFLEDGRPVLVQEFVDGPTLAELLEGFDAKIFPLMSMMMVSDILLALEEPHQQKIIHRDLKPQNILVTKSGQIKITDFGIAKQIQSQTTHLTTSIIGSPSYMSPEQAKGEKNIDQRSDIFSVGIILYQLCTNQLPFVGENYGEVIYKIINDGVIAANKINPYVGLALNEIIQRSLSKNVSERYQFAHEMRSDLLKLTYGLSLEASGPELLEYFMLDKSRFLQSAGLMHEKIKLELLQELKKTKNKLSRINICSQVLEIDPYNELALRTIGQLTTKKNKKYLWLLLLLPLLFIPFYLKPEPVIEPIKPVSDALVKVEKPVVVPRAVEVEKPIVKLPPVKVKEIAPVVKTYLKFIVDQDVFIFVDGKELVPDSKGRIEVAPGSHWIKLVKNNFLPIEAKVGAKKGETVVINTKGQNP